MCRHPQLDPETVDVGRDLGALPVGPAATVGDVADVEEVEARATIARVNGAPSATITAEIIGDDTGARLARQSPPSSSGSTTAGELPAGVDRRRSAA